MSSFSWNDWFEDDEREASQALAAAGVLTAAERNVAHANPLRELDTILMNSAGGILDWSTPPEGDMRHLRKRDVKTLAAAWNQAMAHGTDGARLLIDPGLIDPGQTGRVEDHRFGQDLNSVIQALASPWMDESAGDARVGVRAVSIRSPADESFHQWNWPLRMGVQDGALGMVRDRLEVAKPIRRGQASIEPLSDQNMMDVILRGTHEESFPSPGRATGLDMFVGRPGSLSAEWLSNAARADHPIAYLSVDPQRAPARTATLTAELLDQFAHNRPLDVALFDAHRAVMARMRNFRRIDAPLLFVPGRQATHIFDEVLMTKRAQELLLKIERLPLDYRLGLPTSSSQHLGISPLAVTANDYAISLRRAIRDGQLNFNREIRGSKGLLELNQQVDTSVMRNISSDPAITVRDTLVAGAPPGLPPIDAETAATPRQPEGGRFTDVTLYRGGYVRGDEIPATDKMTDDETLLAGEQYTIEIALRRQRTGISASKEAPVVLNPRQQRETLKIYVSVNSRISSLLILEPFQTIEWAYDQDSSSALFKLTVDKPLPALWVDGAIEIRIYHNNLDLLDIVMLKLTAVSHAAIPGDPCELLWPRSGKAMPQLDPDNFVRSLSIDVQSTPAGYKFRFIACRDRGQKVELFSERSITDQDIESLLGKVRDYLTKLVVTQFASTVTVSKTTWQKTLRDLAEIGQQAWVLLFGARTQGQKGAPETIGDWIEDADLKEGTYVQITHASTLSGFVFPWTLLYPTRYEVDAKHDVDPLQFWGTKFRIEQVAEGRRNADLAQEPIKVTFGLDPEFGESAAQQKMFADFERLSANRLVVGPALQTSETLLKALSQDPASHVVYFFCHGFSPRSGAGEATDLIKSLQETVEKMPAGTPERAFCQKLIDLKSRVGQEAWIFIGSEITNSALAKEKFFYGRRPIVFLNMCHSAALLPSMTTGIVRTFLDHDAVAVIGTESPMTSVFANVFAEKFFSYLFAGTDAVDALWNARRHFVQPDMRNPLGLAYTLYGRAGAKVGNGPVVDVKMPIKAEEEKHVG